MRNVLVAAVLLSFAASPAAAADFGYSPHVRMMPPAPGVHWNAWAGQYRYIHHHVGDFVLDRDGTGAPISDWGEHRLRLSPAFTWNHVGIKVEMDVLSGQLYGDHEDLYPGFGRLERRDGNDGRSFDSFLLREAYVQFVAPLGMVRVGQMTSRYGLGILSNAGVDDDDRFGARRYGDIVDRALVLIKPFQSLTGPRGWGDYFALMGALDFVYRDENARWEDGDRAWMGNGGLYFLHPRFTNAAIFTWRTQTDDDEDELEASVLNLNGMNRLVFSWTEGPPGAGDAARVPDASLYLGYELVWIWGQTTRFQQVGTEEGLDLESFGGAGRLGVTLESLGLEVEVEVGYASGDANAHDDTSHAFFFDPDYNVGLIFFDEMLPLITARAAELSSDPATLAQAPKGVDLVPSQERVTNALYTMPQVRYTWRPSWAAVESVKLLGAGLILTSATEFAHSYYTFQNGGSAANHLGAPTQSKYLGTELLAGVHAMLWPWRDHLGLSLRVEQSWFMPGAALEDADGSLPDPVWKILAGAALHWQ